MPKFRKKPVVIDAVQWFKEGDSTDVDPMDFAGDRAARFDNCRHCSQVWVRHGWIETLEGGHIVCPSDWIITGVAGETYPCKNAIFEATYDPA